MNNMLKNLVIWLVIGLVLMTVFNQFNTPPVAQSPDGNLVVLVGLPLGVFAAGGYVTYMTALRLGPISVVSPVTVSYGTEIVKDLSGVAFLQADASVPEELLKQSVVTRLFGKDRKLAIGLNGIAWFLPDEKLGHALSVLYDWAAPGSKLFLTDVPTPEATETSDKLADFYKKVNQPVYYRDEKRLRELLGKWTVCEPGIQRLEKWMPIDPSFRLGGKLGNSSGELVGAIVTKK